MGKAKEQAKIEEMKAAVEEQAKAAAAEEQAKIEEMKAAEEQAKAAAAEEQAKINEINAKVMALGNERDNLKSRIAQLKQLVADAYATEEKIIKGNEPQLSDFNEKTTQEIFEEGIPGDAMDFEKMTVTQLKEQLKSRGLKVSG